MADVPELFWKYGKQGASRGAEGPNHFAAMDQKRPSDGEDLLTLCEHRANVDADTWNAFYNSVRDPVTGEEITQNHRGLLPFRVWQIFDDPVTRTVHHRDGAVKEVADPFGKGVHSAYEDDGEREPPGNLEGPEANARGNAERARREWL